MDYLTLATKYLGVEFDEIFIMQCGDCGEIRCKIDRMGLWEYRNSLTECQLTNNDLVKLLRGDYKIKQISKKEDSERVLPTPCTKVEKETIKDWFQKINEELDELKAAVLFAATTDGDIDDVPDDYKALMNPLEFEASYREIAEEAADTITAITSMLEAMGIDENMRQDAQRRVNEKNKERRRF